MAQRDKYKVAEIAALHGVVRRHGFATVVAPRDGALFATHVPLTLRADGGEPGVLEGHVAIANPLWRVCDGTTEVLAIFGGPDAYVSPRWYVERDRVPTWNYVAVHAWGKPQLVQDRAEKLRLLQSLLDDYESGPGAWSMARLLPDELDDRLARIVFFQIPITRIEGVFKLSQDKASAERALVRAGLERTGAPEALAVAAYMASHSEDE
jgi:transcriptional regulator